MKVEFDLENVGKEVHREFPGHWWPEIERFVIRAIKAENEGCAREVDPDRDKLPFNECEMLDEIAATIRARVKPDKNVCNVCGANAVACLRNYETHGVHLKQPADLAE